MSLAAMAVGSLYLEVAAAHRGDNPCPCGWEPHGAADLEALQTFARALGGAASRRFRRNSGRRQCLRITIGDWRILPQATSCPSNRCLRSSGSMLSPQFDFCAIARLRSWSNDATMRRGDQFPFRHFDRPKPPVPCRGNLGHWCELQLGSLDPFDILCRQMTAIRANRTAGVEPRAARAPSPCPLPHPKGGGSGIAAGSARSMLRRTRPSSALSIPSQRPFAFSALSRCDRRGGCCLPRSCTVISDEMPRPDRRRLTFAFALSQFCRISPRSRTVDYRQPQGDRSGVSA
jgi:hypothetical protein